MKLIILGAAQSGKDTVAEYLSDQYNLNFLATSIHIAKNVIMPAFPEKYKDYNECYIDRVNNRKIWAELINQYCNEDPCRIINEIFEVSDIYCGLRNVDQLNSYDVKLYDLSIWVERPGYSEDLNSMNIRKEDADIVIYNDKDLSDLYAKLDRLFCLFDNFFFDSENYNI